MPSFDIVSKTDVQEVDNAVNQAIKEMQQRYDFKGTKSEIKWEKKEEITVLADDDGKLRSILDILQTKLVKRGVSLKSLDYGKEEDASGGMKRQVIKIRQGIPSEKAKEITKLIKDQAQGPGADNGRHDQGHGKEDRRPAGGHTGPEGKRSGHNPPVREHEVLKDWRQAG